MELEPYVFFYGRCEEALEFYKSAIGGTYEANRFEGSPMAERVPPEMRNLIMHATFTGDGFTFMASDGDPNKSIDPEAGNIVLSLGIPDRAHAQKVFDALAQGGDVRMPLADAFWGGAHGSVTDKFGIEWMITSN